MSPNKERAFLLVDRDGVINEDVATSVCREAQFSLIERSVRAIVELSRAGYGIILITNQACIGRGDTTDEIVSKIHKSMIENVVKQGGNIVDIFMCPHTPEDHCDCRKPLPGLIHQARDKYTIDLTKTWFVGDSKRDIDAAKNAGCIPALVLTGRGQQTQAEVTGVAVFKDLKAFSEHLLAQQI